jgi:CYTH domain-containing protein
MALEVEHKFLVAGSGWRDEAGAGEPCCQGYLNRDPERTVRVRVAGEQAFLTVKGITRGVTRQEFEWPIAMSEANALLRLCEGPLIEKTRYRLDYLGTQWEIDEFHGDNEGLVIAEVELGMAGEPFERPEWLGDEVSHDSRYFNSSLSIHPYAYWSKKPSRSA